MFVCPIFCFVGFAVFVVVVFFLFLLHIVVAVIVDCCGFGIDPILCLNSVECYVSELLILLTYIFLVGFRLIFVLFAVDLNFGCCCFVWILF